MLKMTIQKSAILVTLPAKFAVIVAIFIVFYSISEGGNTYIKYKWVVADNKVMKVLVMESDNILMSKCC